MLLISFLSWDLQPHSALNWSCIFSVNFCYKVRTVFFFGLILRKSTLFLRRENKNTVLSVLRHFTCELCPCELYPVILTCERYTFISRLSSPSSLETSALWKKKWKRITKLLEEAGYERQQTSNIKTTLLKFMLEAPWRCTILCFLLANCDGIKWCDGFIGQ